MKQTIAIDIDDVLAASTDLIRMYANKATGLSLQPHHYTVPGPYWSYYAHILEAHGITDKQEQSRILDGWISSHSDAEPVQGAIDALTALSQQYTIVLITARDPKIRQDTEDWLKTYFAGLYQDLHLIGNFKVVDNPKTKGEVCAQVGASWLVDDNPEHCMTAIDNGVDTVLFGEYGWQHEAPDHLVRCKNWAAVLEYFDGQPK